MVSAVQGKSEGHVGWVGLVASGVEGNRTPTRGRSIEKCPRNSPSKLCSQRENTLAIVGPLTAQMIPLG